MKYFSKFNNQSLFAFLALIVFFLLVFIYRHSSFHNNSELVKVFLRFPNDSNSDECNLGKSLTEAMGLHFKRNAVQESCNLTERIYLFNEALHQLRLTSIQTTYSRNWTNVSALNEIKVIASGNDEFLQQLRPFSQVKTMYLPWRRDKTTSTWSSYGDHSNILIQNYFEWTADDKLCFWITSIGGTRARYDVIYNRTCYSNVTRGMNAHSLSVLSLNAKPVYKPWYWPNNGRAFPDYFYLEPPQFAFYLHVIRDCIVSSVNEIWSGNLKLVQFGCTYSMNPAPPPDIDRIPLYDEVMSLSQFWGEGVYHRMVEVMPRLSLYVDFLRRNPSIKIQTADKSGRTVELLKILGLSENRIVTGNFRAKLVYVPRSTMCGWANVQEIQVVSALYRKFIVENFPAEPRNKIVLIQRSGRRRFSEKESIEKMIRNITEANNFSFVVYADNPAPPINETMQMFHSAVMVIAPHGAGLSNILFSQPGTFVIEGVCHPPEVNLCYLRLAYVLGHHWHGVSAQGGCPIHVNVTADRLHIAIKLHIELLKEGNKEEREGRRTT